ncbi:MAG: DUF721 domain-containing protein [bacterium]
MEPLSESLQEFIKEKGLKEPFQKSRLIEEWEQIAGDVFASHLKIVKFANKRLVLVASDPGWSHQAELLKPQLKEKINNHFGEQIVKDIRIKN